MRIRSLLILFTLGVIAPFYAHAAGASCLPKSSAGVLNAVEQGNVALLVKCGLKINQPVQINHEPTTLLAFAASLGRPDIVEQVLAAGADPNPADASSVVLSPLEIALSSRKYAAAKVLLEHGARGDYALPGSGATALMAIAFNPDSDQEASDIIKALQRYGAQLDAQDSKGNTPLHWAARAGNETVVRQLLQQGANACLKNAKGLYPIEVVKTSDQQAIAARLRQACPLPAHH